MPRPGVWGQWGGDGDGGGSEFGRLVGGGRGMGEEGTEGSEGTVYRRTKKRVPVNARNVGRRRRR